MAITHKPNAKISENEKYTIKLMDEYKIKGFLSHKRKDITTYYVRLPGMLSYFICRINYKEIKRLRPYIEHLYKALLERVEQEEGAKQCGILLRRLHKLSYGKNHTKLSHLLPIDVFNYKKSRDKVSEEEAKLYDEFLRLYPLESTKYKENYKRPYNNHTLYWDAYIQSVKFRFKPTEYIPINKRKNMRRRKAII